jgi:hypothetical protein
VIALAKRGVSPALLLSQIAYRAVVQNKQDCPEDSGHWELRESDSEALLLSQIALREKQKSRSRLASFACLMVLTYLEELS